jgi:hypothetical protein
MNTGRSVFLEFVIVHKTYSINWQRWNKHYEEIT